MNIYGVLNEYERKFNTSIPKKQAKSYEIDLGQNNGPYKEDLLIRYGDNTLNHKSQKDRNENMDILRMNQMLYPFQERTPEVEENNLYERCDIVEDNLNYLEEESIALKESEQIADHLYELSTNEIFKMFDDSYNEFNPEMMAKYKYLKTQIKDQKDENSNLLKQIDLLNQEISSILENIVKLGIRIDSLEKHVGVDKKEVSEESEEDDDDD